MNEPLTPPDPVEKSGEFTCQNCGTILPLDYKDKTIDDDEGCTECTTLCDICRECHFTQDMYLCVYCGRICNDCVASEDYKQTIKDYIIKEALQYYFSRVDHIRTEQTIIRVARELGYNQLAHEMKNDL